MIHFTQRKKRKGKGERKREKKSFEGGLRKRQRCRLNFGRAPERKKEGVRNYFRIEEKNDNKEKKEDSLYVNRLGGGRGGEREREKEKERRKRNRREKGEKKKGKNENENENKNEN